jgi:hypothetical protein
MSNYTLESPINITPSGILRIFETNSTNAISISSTAGASGVDFTLPSNAGAAGQFLQRTSATSTSWVTGTSTQTSNTMPITIRLTRGNFPSPGINITSGVFTILGYFIFGGTTLSQTIHTITVIFAVSPASTAGAVRLGDVTNAIPNIYTHTCTSGATTITFSTSNLNTVALPTGQALMVLSAAVTTATTLTLYSVSFS